MAEDTKGIGRLIKKINQEYIGLISYEITGRNLTVPQIFVLRCITEQRQMISTISEKVLLSNSTVSGIIDRLVKSGYVNRFRDPDDRRVVWITQSEKLIQLRKELPVLNENYFQFLLEDLDSSEVEQIQSSLELLSKHMQEKITKYKNR